MNAASVTNFTGHRTCWFRTNSKFKYVQDRHIKICYVYITAVFSEFVTLRLLKGHQHGVVLCCFTVMKSHSIPLPTPDSSRYHSISPVSPPGSISIYLTSFHRWAAFSLRLVCTLRYLPVGGDCDVAKGLSCFSGEMFFLKSTFIDIIRGFFVGVIRYSCGRHERAPPN